MKVSNCQCKDLMKIFSLLLFSLFFSCNSEVATEVSDVINDDDDEVVESRLIPEGMIQAFNLSSCPDGWDEYSSGNGRSLIGSGSR